MLWQMYNGGSSQTVANDHLTKNDTKYSTSKNPSTGLYYRLHILNVGVSDVKEYRCSGVLKTFYLKLDLSGKCTITLVIFKQV